MRLNRGVVVIKRLRIIFLILLISFESLAEMKLPISYYGAEARAGFTSPLIELSINGRPGLFLIDTGAPLHVVSQWFAAEAKIKPSKQGYLNDAADSGGAELVTLDIEMLTSRGEKKTFYLQQSIIVDLPNEFKHENIVGIISPQQLIKDSQCLLLNFSKPTFSIFESGDKKCKSQQIPITLIKAKGSENLSTSLYLIKTSIEGTSTSFIIDSGADSLAVGTKSKAGLSLLPRSIETKEMVSDINGTKSHVRVLPYANLLIGSRIIKVDLRIQSVSEKMPADGIMGMQILKNCTLMLTRQSGSISCY